MNIFRWRVLYSIVFSVPYFWVFTGFAQSPSCSCVTSLEGASGEISAITGRVLSSGDSGLGPASTGTRIGAGSQIIIGSDSSAEIAVGSCSLTAGENTEVMLQQIGGDICVQLTQAGAPFNQADASPANLAPAIVGGSAAAAVLGAAIVERIQDDAGEPPLGPGPGVSR